MQLLAKFKKALFMKFRAILDFRKVKVTLNPKAKCAPNLENGSSEDSYKENRLENKVHFANLAKDFSSAA